MAAASPARAQEEFSKAAAGEIEIVQDGPAREWCPLCGMTLRQYYKTSHAHLAADGTKRHFCSLHCLAKHLAGAPDAEPAGVRVADARTNAMIDAATAVYVLGSRVPGTMSQVSALAFGDRASADAFVGRHGGRVSDFKEALRLTRERIAADDAMVQARKRQTIVPSGQKLFASSCDAKAAASGEPRSVAQLKASLVASKACPKLDDPKLHAVAVYLWESRQAQSAAPSAPPLQVAKEDKCPVCGMFVAPYPEWVAQIELAGGKRLSFDGARDFFKYLQHPAKWGPRAGEKDALWVTDYYSRARVDARKAFYVIGSDVLGPMGHELVPFATREKAQEYLADHKGEKVVTFEQVTAELVSQLEKRP